MKMSNGTASMLTLALLTVAGQVSAQSTPGVPPAQGEDIQVTANATAICQGVRPSDNAQLNYRALQLDNVGTQSQFITCSFATLRDQGDSENQIVSYFGAFFSNQNSTERTVTCTGVQGFANDPNNVYEAQSVTVLPNNQPGTPDTGYIFFGPASGDPLYYQNVSMTCLVPGGVSIADTYVGFKLNDAGSAPPTAQP